MKKTTGRKLLAAGIAASLGALTFVGGATAANAEAINTDPAARGTIIIHKHENPGNGAQTPDGSGTAPNTPGIAGVVFEYCRIDGINLLDGTNTGWNQLNGITSAQMTTANVAGGTTLGSYTLSGCTSAPATDGTGLATTPPLPLGPYFVREISAPDTVIEKAAPFVVALPTPKNLTTLNGEWVYNVNVYPKNTVGTPPRKNIVKQPQNGAALGAPIDYEVTTRIPALATGKTYNKFVLTDTLDAKLDPNLDLSTVSVKFFGGTAFVQGTDYTPVWSGQTLTVTMLAPGLAKIQAQMANAQSNKNLVVAFRAKANAVGAIDNTAYVNLNDLDLQPGDGTTPPGGNNPTNTVQTRWGAVQLQKVNVDKPTDGLAGAVFHVWMSTSNTAGCKADFATLTQVTKANSTEVYEATAGADGTISIPGLWVGDTELVIAADGTVTEVPVAGHDFQQRCYVLQEVKAPAGFILPTGDAALTEVIVKTGAVSTVDPIQKITNKQQNVPELPLTGAAGQVIMFALGGGLIVVALGAILIVRRRSYKA